MKYIYDDARTVNHLNDWARESLVVAVFFFWNSGIRIQTSQDGLLRSLLYQILIRSSDSGDLIPYLLPQRWDVCRLFGHCDSHWSHQDLRKVFQ